MVEKRQKPARELGAIDQHSKYYTEIWDALPDNLKELIDE